MDFSKTKIKYLITHEIGNKLRDEKLFLSQNIQIIDNEIEKTLLSYFLKSFQVVQDEFNFFHNSDLNLNEVNSYTTNIFEKQNEISFVKNSQDIAKHLYDFSLHPKIVKGELIIVQLCDIGYDNQNINIIGVFKSEKKDSFLKIIKDNEAINLNNDQGINTSKIEKGCLILNTNDNRYKVFNIDNQSNSTDYWTNKFLNIKPLKNNIHKTKEIIKICINFSDEILSTNYDTDIEFSFNNDYIDYFESNESYDLESFTSHVFKNEDVKKEFFEYQSSNKEVFDIELDERFEVSQNDVKKEKKKIKNIIKLDTKLELKVLLDKDSGTKNIEKGFDTDKGMSFYKIYFNEEIK